MWEVYHICLQCIKVEEGGILSQSINLWAFFRVGGENYSIWVLSCIRRTFSWQRWVCKVNRVGWFCRRVAASSSWWMSSCYWGRFNMSRISTSSYRRSKLYFGCAHLTSYNPPPPPPRRHSLSPQSLMPIIFCSIIVRIWTGFDSWTRINRFESNWV